MKSSRTLVLTEAAVRQRAEARQQRIRATVVHRAPQVMVKVTGGGRGMGAIAAHLRYIAKAGRLPIEDDRGAVRGRAGRPCARSPINGGSAARASRRPASAARRLAAQPSRLGALARCRGPYRREAWRAQVGTRVSGHALGHDEGLGRDHEGAGGIARPSRPQAQQEHRLLRHADASRSSGASHARRAAADWTAEHDHGPRADLTTGATGSAPFCHFGLRASVATSTCRRRRARPVSARSSAPSAPPARPTGSAISARTAAANWCHVRFDPPPSWSASRRPPRGCSNRKAAPRPELANGDAWPRRPPTRNTGLRSAGAP